MLAQGTKVAGYRIDSFLAQGGMGVVYRATQLALDRRVALKLIAPELARDAHFRERFKRESRLAAQIEHPNVIPVHEAGEADGQLYIAMRFIEGTDLYREIQRHGRLEPRRTAQIVAQVGDALDAAHRRGLIHRDVKPANVLLADGHAYLTDFGLVKDLAGDAPMTSTGEWVGTPDYVAPELFKGDPVDGRADVYALGCVLSHALTGRVPFPRDQAVAKMWAHVEEPPPHPSELAPGVPPQLDEVVVRAMAKDPDERYPSAGDLGRAALAAAERRPPPTGERSVARGDAAPDSSDPDTPTRDDEPTRARQPIRADESPAGRRRWLVAALAAAAIALIAAGAIVLASGGGDPNQAGARNPARPAGPVKLATIPLGGQIRAIAAGGGSVWALGRGATLVRVGAKTNKRVGFVGERLGGAATAMTYGFGAVWANVRQRGQSRAELVKVDPRTGKPIKRLTIGHRALGLTTSPKLLWLTYLDDDAVQRIDPATIKPIGKPVRVDKGPWAIAADDKTVWVTQFGHKPKLAQDPGGGVVHFSAPLDPLDKTQAFYPSAPVPAGRKPNLATFGGGYVWIGTGFNELTRIDPERIETLQVFPDGFGGLTALVGDSKRIYIAGWKIVDKDQVRALVARLDPETGKVMGKRADLGVIPDNDLNIDLALGEGALWAAVRGKVFKLKP